MQVTTKIMADILFHVVHELFIDHVILHEPMIQVMRFKRLVSKQQYSGFIPTLVTIYRISQIGHGLVRINSTGVKRHNSTCSNRKILYACTRYHKHIVISASKSGLNGCLSEQLTVVVVSRSNHHLAISSQWVNWTLYGFLGSYLLSA